MAHLDDGSTIHADRVVAAPGIASFAVEPAFVTERLAPEQWSHTVRTVDFAGLAGRRVLILGGRQSAFEWAALLAEAGAERVDLVYRHDTPAFTESDWSFVDELLAETRRTRGWFRGLPEAERKAIAQRFWQVGRLQLEPWLAPRITAAHLHPRTEIAELTANGAITARLTDGTSIEADHLLLATGYAPDMTRVPYLPPIELADGFPVLDPDFQTSVPGLYIPGFPSTRDFGPFFGFVAGATTTARDHRRGAQRAVRCCRHPSWMPSPKPNGAASSTRGGPGPTPSHPCHAPRARRRTSSGWPRPPTCSAATRTTSMRSSAPITRTSTPATASAPRAARSGWASTSCCSARWAPRPAGSRAPSGWSIARVATASSAATC